MHARLDARPFLAAPVFLAAALAAAAGTDAPAEPNPLPGGDAAADSTPPAVAFRAGGDLRIRQESFDDIPIRTASPAVTRGGRNDYFRVRARLNAGLDFGEDASFDVRVCDEFRVRNIGVKSYEWPDELVVDQLKLSLRGLWDDRADLTLGRQDLSLGSGRLFAEGTAKDGSRTQFFDGARLRLRLDEKRTLDVFGFYGACENRLAVGHEHRDITGLAGGFTDMDEASAGFFYDDRSDEALGWGVYGVWFLDTSWKRPDGSRAGREDVQTLGARLLPVFSEEWSAELEAAVQASGNGGYDRRAWFAESGLKRSFGLPGETPAWVSANALFLSGDDPDTARREDFHVLYGRYPWISELLLYGFDGDGVGTWRNLGQAWIEFGATPGGDKANRIKLTAGPVWAPEEDGAGGGSFRGWLETAFWAFPLAKGDFGDLAGHLFLELFEPGGYYASSRTAFFFRWQLEWSF